MNRLARVAIYEYRRTVFQANFVWALLSVPLMLALSLGVGFFMESLQENRAPLGYVDHAGVLAQAIPAPVHGAEKAVGMIAYPSEAAARAALEAGQLQAYFVVAETYSWSRGVALYYFNEPGQNAVRQFADFLQINLMAGQPPDLARRAALLEANVTVRSLDGRRNVPAGGPTFTLMLSLLVGMAFVVLILMSSGYLMQAVVEEKENRTIEVLVTSVSPAQLIRGKVLGIVAVALTQLAVWAIIAVLVVAAAGRLGVAWFQNPRPDWDAVLTTLALALPSFALTAALMVAAGVMLTSSQESQPVSTAFALLHMIPLLTAPLIVMTPNAALPVAMSFLPFTSLLTVVLRNLFSAVPLWQVAVSVGIQVLGAAGALWLASHAFRRGMLRYGQRVRLREFMARSRLSRRATASVP